MVELVILVPFITGIIAFFLPKASARPLLVLTGIVHLLLSVMIWIRRPAPVLDAYFALSPEGLLSLLVISLLFFLIAIYTMAYLKAADIALLMIHLKPQTS